MNFDRTNFVLSLLRCLKCGKRDWEISKQLECASCGASYRLIEDKPIFHDDMSVSQINTEHHSHETPQYIINLMTSVEGFCLHLGSGSQTKTFSNVIECDYVLYPSVDVAVDAHNLPFDDNSFDLVVSLNVFEHLYNPVKAAGEIHRVLKPGGTIFIRTAFLQPLHSKPHHYFNATEYGVRKWFETFEIEKLYVSYNFHPGVTLSWIISEILKTAERHLSKKTMEEIRTQSLSYWETAYKNGFLDELGLIEEFKKLPQSEQARIATGFELIAKTPHQLDINKS